MGGGQFKSYVFLSHSKNNLEMKKDNPIVTNGWKKMKKVYFLGALAMTHSLISNAPKK